MSKTKLMKIGPARSHFRCRDRGKLSGKNGIRSGAVKKPPKVKAESKPVSKLILRKELLNPAKETMIPITYEDFVKMGRYSLHPDIDHKLCKYHDELVRSGTFVTPELLKAKSIELFKKAGIRVNESKRSSQWIQAFMVRCGRFRAAKSRGFGTDSRSLKRFDNVYSDELRKMEPVCFKTRSKEAKACTCGKSRLKAQSISETSSPITSLFATPPSEIEDTSVETGAAAHQTSLLNLFAKAADSEDSVSAAPGTFIAPRTKKLSRLPIIERGLCFYCLRQLRLKRKEERGQTFAGYDFQDYSFPELLPPSPRKAGCGRVLENSYPFHDMELSDCSDNTASDLFDIAQLLT